MITCAEVNDSCQSLFVSKLMNFFEICAEVHRVNFIRAEVCLPGNIFRKYKQYHLRRLECNDLSYITFTNIIKMHETLINSKVSKNIRNQGETLFCWAFAISTMLRQSLNTFINKFDQTTFNKKDALKDR